VPWRPLLRRMWPVTLTYFCYGWSLWLYLNWLPLFFKNNYSLDIRNSALFASGVFFAGVIGDSLGGILSDRILKKTGDIRFARLSVTITGFAGALLSLLPILFIHDITIVALCLSGGFFFAELVIGPMWSVPMDIAPKYSGTAAGLMNTGSALAAIVSPLVAGYVIDVTGNWYLPFLMSMGLLLLGGFSAFLMHPEHPFEDVGTPGIAVGRTASLPR
jgi:MFS family permease